MSRTFAMTSAPTAEFLTFSEAARRAGVSRQRLNRAIHLGYLPAERGGGPGKPTRIRLEDLQAWCASERLPVPLASERSEHTQALMAQPDVAALMERLEHTEHSQKAEVLRRIQALKAEGFSLQHIADRLNADGVPTLSGRGKWQKGTVGNLLAGERGTR